MKNFGNLLRRCRPRFGLRTLLLFALLLGVWGYSDERNWLESPNAPRGFLTAGRPRSLSPAELQEARWRGEVEALRALNVGRGPKAYARGASGEERELAGPDDLQPWETVVRTAYTAVRIDEMKSILSKLPNIKNIGFAHVSSADDYRKLIDIQRNHKNVDINWEFCNYLPHPRWFREPNDDRPRALSDVQIAERDFYRLKGWDTSFMQLYKWKEPTE